METSSSVLCAWTRETLLGLLKAHLLFFRVTLFSGCTRKTRIIDTVYNASNNELVRTKTLVKGSIITIDAVPFRQWYEAHYAMPLGPKGKRKFTEEEEAKFNKQRSKKAQKKYQERQKSAAVEQHLIEQYQAGRLLGKIDFEIHRLPVAASGRGHLLPQF